MSSSTVQHQAAPVINISIQAQDIESLRRSRAEIMRTFGQAIQAHGHSM